MNDRNVNSRVEKLTEAQKQCLRLVADLMSSKQIARALQISHHTVDQRLKRAQSILNVSGRAEAARMLMSYEAETGGLDSDIYESLVYQSSDLPQYRYARNDGSSADEWSPSVDSGETELRESQAFIFDQPARASKWSTLFSALFEVDRENQLSISARLGLMLLIMMTGLIAFALLVSVAEGLSRIA